MKNKRADLNLYTEEEFRKAVPKVHAKCRELLHGLDVYFGQCWTDTDSLWVYYNFNDDEDRRADFEFVLPDSVATPRLLAYNLNERD